MMQSAYIGKRLLQTPVRRPRELKLPSATLDLNVPPQIRIEIQDIRAAIDTIVAQLGVVRLVLPAPVADFVGCDDEIAQLVAVLSAAAQRLVSIFPDSQILIALQGTGD